MYVFLLLFNYLILLKILYIYRDLLADSFTRLASVYFSFLGFFKGTVSRDFLLLVFFMNQFPPSPRESY
jgi:hypothetical protein